MHFHAMDDRFETDPALFSQGGAAPLDSRDLETALPPPPPPPPPYDDPFDDVFGVDYSTTTGSEFDQTSRSADPFPRSDRIERHVAHPSDVPRLQAEHTTAGYREGISAGKEKTVQKGFDEGFSLGATIGLTAGRLIGMLEGLETALGEGWDDRARDMLARAREDLSTRRIFGAEYWNPDGSWSYDVKPADESARDEDVTFADVASSHPLIVKWALAVAEETERWNVDVNLMLDEEEVSSSLHLGEGQASSSKAPITTPSSKKSLDW